MTEPALQDRADQDRVATNRLPLAHLPATVLPGAVVTIALIDDGLRRAVDAARAQSDGRLVFQAQSDGDGPTGSGGVGLGVIARVPDIGALPTGEPVAIVKVESRARIVAVHASERAGAYVDVEIVLDPRPTPRVEALARDLRSVLEPIAELRRSRRLPELLRTATDPGALADGVVSACKGITWSQVCSSIGRASGGGAGVGRRVACR